MTFRKILFWSHLAAGLISGIAIGIMCFTGTALAFEKQLVAWAERDVRRIEPPSANATRLPLDELQAKLRDAQPEANTANIVLQNDRRAAVAFSAGGRGGARGNYVNPYTGEVRQPQSSALSSFMQTMVSWHRYLGFTGTESRPRGKLINGICNLAFCVLAITGLYLWMPRHWSLRGVKSIALFNWRLTGKARDFNWHNTIGLWSAPILIVLTLTAVPISFQWGTRVINTLTGTTPAPPGTAREAAPVPNLSPARTDAVPLAQEALFAVVQKEIPRWLTITSGAGRGGARASAPGAAATFTVREAGSWPRTANTTLTLNAYTGEVLSRTGYADQAPAQRVRSWTRFLHTGEALGLGGQLVAGLACLGGCFLVYTGFALSWRRFVMKRPPEAAAKV